MVASVRAVLLTISARESRMVVYVPIDPDLLEQALRIGDEKTKKTTVEKALREFIARREQKRILDLFGTLEWDEGYDYKRGRRRH